MRLITKKDTLWAVKITAGVVLMAIFFYVSYEPGLVQAIAPATANVVVTLEVDTGISITVDSATKKMSTMLGVSTNIAVGTTTFTVATNDPNGYTLGLSASTNPAMKAGSLIIADYATTTMPTLWSVTSGDARFGYSVFGTDVNTSTWGTGSFCNGAATSTVPTLLKYYGFYTNATTTASRAATTTPAGVVTTVCYAAQQNGTYIAGGTYTATITGTATAL
jgi:hypothetical protein